MDVDDVPECGGKILLSMFHHETNNQHGSIRITRVQQLLRLWKSMRRLYRHDPLQV